MNNDTIKLNEAIKHCHEVAMENEDCIECRNEHLQLAKWLQELKSYREYYDERKQINMPGLWQKS